MPTGTVCLIYIQLLSFTEYRVPVADAEEVCTVDSIASKLLYYAASTLLFDHKAVPVSIHSEEALPSRYGSCQWVQLRAVLYNLF